MGNWCVHVNCGKRIENRVLYCPHCGGKQPKGLEDPNREYKDLIYKQATEGLTDEEQEDLERLQEQLRRRTQ